MNKITSNHDFYTTTETSRQYIDHGNQFSGHRPTAANELVEADLLILNKYRDSLNVDTLEIPQKVTKTMPPEPYRRRILPLPDPIDYQQYTAHLAECYPRLFGNISTDHIRQLLNDRNRTVYHMDYCSPKDGIVSMGTRKREAVRNGRLPSGWQIDTTYQSSYRSSKDIGEIGEISRSRSFKPPVGKEQQLNAKLRDIFKIGKSEYTERLGDEADLSIELGRYGAQERVGYLDRYTKTK